MVFPIKKSKSTGSDSIISGFFQRIVILLLLASICGGCAALAIGTATTFAVKTARQEKPFEVFVEDTIIAAKIKNRFRKADFDNLFMSIGVKVINGSVILTGKAKDKDVIIKAMRIAWSVPGVNEVIDEIARIENEDEKGSYTKDAVITTAVKSRLLFDKTIKSSNYSVETVNGTVYLIGVAANKNEIENVVTIISRVNAVKRVVSYVRTKDEIISSSKEGSIE